MVDHLPYQHSQRPPTYIISSTTSLISTPTKSNLSRNKKIKVDEFLNGYHHQHKEINKKLPIV